MAQEFFGAVAIQVEETNACFVIARADRQLCWQNQKEVGGSLSKMQRKPVPLHSDS
jgi:hypothetical protein